MLKDTEKAKLIISMQKTVNSLHKQIEEINKNKVKLITQLYKDSNITFEEFNAFYNEVKLIRGI